MNSKQTEADYVPYGPEWEKEMSKFPKAQLVKMLGKAYQEKKELKQSLPSKPVGDVEEMLNEKLEFYREQTDRVRELVFGRKDIGTPCQPLYEAIVDKITSLEKENEQLKSGYAAAPQKGMDEKKIKINLLWELIQDWQDSRELDEDIHEPKFSYNDIEKEFYDKMEVIDPQSKTKTLDESPSPSEAGDAPFCQWCGYRKKFKGDGTIEPLCTC